MDPQILNGAFRIAVLVLGLALVILPFQPAGSAEFVVTVMAAAVGALFLIAVVVLARLANPAPPGDRGERRD